MAAGYFGAVRGHVMGLRMGVRLRDRMVAQISNANLRVIERVGVPTIHHHMMATIGRVGEAYGTLLGFVASLVILACNLVYIGWLSPIGLVLALIVAASGVLIHLRQEARNSAL